MSVPQGKRDPVRVVVVDDSPSAQELLVTILQGAESIDVVGTGLNGEDAIRLTERLHPDVVTMDIRMPRMDGLEATRRIMREAPTPIVVVTASAIQTDMTLTFESLRAGALTVIGKPSLDDVDACEEVVQTVRLMSEVPVVHHWGKLEMSETLPPQPTSVLSAPEEKVDSWRHAQMIGIASSTGGPATLATVLGSLPADFSVPILVVQHIAHGFIASMAEWLDGVTPLRVGLASHGEVPQPGTVLLAPDDYHVQVNSRKEVKLDKGPPYKGLRPSANHLFRSLARVYGPRAVGVVLTGMGDDGADGLLAMRQAGGLTIAQDEQSCAVYGMPCEAIARDAVEWIVSSDQIASELNRVVGIRKEAVFDV